MAELSPLQNLNDETITLILSFVNTIDLVRMRSTASRFSNLIDKKMPISFTELLVCPNLFRLHNNRWKGSDKLIDYRSSLVPAANFRFKPAAVQDLEKLKIVPFVNYDFVHSLQNFKKLQHLEIATLNIQADMQTLNLLKLKYFSVDCVTMVPMIQAPRVQLNLKAPALRAVSFGENSIDYFKLSHPQKITSLELEIDTYGQCTQFTKLTNFTCNRILQFSIETLEKLLVYPQMKSMFLNTNTPQYLGHSLDPESGTQLKYLFHRLWDFFWANQDKFKKTDLYLNSVLITFCKSWHKVNFQRRVSKVLMENPPKERLLSFWHIDYVQHTDDFTNQNFFDQLNWFPNLQALYVNIECNAEFVFTTEHFTKFLKNLRALRRLELVSVPLEREFFENEFTNFECLKTLNYLRLFHKDQLDPSFLLRLEFLSNLATNMTPIGGDLPNLLAGLKKGFYAFYFGFNHLALFIEKKSMDVYDLDTECYPCLLNFKEKRKFTGQTLEEVIAKWEGLVARLTQENELQEALLRRDREWQAFLQRRQQILGPLPILQPIAAPLPSQQPSTSQQPEFFRPSTSQQPGTSQQPEFFWPSTSQQPATSLQPVFFRPSTSQQPATSLQPVFFRPSTSPQPATSQQPVNFQPSVDYFKNRMLGLIPSQLQQAPAPSTSAPQGPSHRVPFKKRPLHRQQEKEAKKSKPSDPELILLDDD